MRVRNVGKELGASNEMKVKWRSAGNFTESRRYEIVNFGHRECSSISIRDSI